VTNGVLQVTDRRRRQQLMAHLPFALVLAVVAVGFGAIFAYHWRWGSGLIGCALLLAAGLRMVLTDRQIGLLAIRSRVVDMLLYGGFGLLVLAIALTITGGLLAPAA
jgi:Protein of unknown function (DUF3017)